MNWNFGSPDEKYETTIARRGWFLLFFALVAGPLGFAIYKGGESIFTPGSLGPGLFVEAAGGLLATAGLIAAAFAFMLWVPTLLEGKGREIGRTLADLLKKGGD